MNEIFSQVNPRFRQITDLLFFSERMDLDLSNYKSMLREKPEHFIYAWDRFQKCCNIYWEDGENFWYHRLSSLLALNDKGLSKRIGEYLEKRMCTAVLDRPSPDIRYDIEYLQFVEYCKVKYDRKEDLQSIKGFLLDMPSRISIDKVISVINTFIPFVFKDFNEFTEAVSQKVSRSSRSFELLLDLERYGYHFDRRPIIKLVKELAVTKNRHDKNRRILFTIFNDEKTRYLLKQDYNSDLKKKVIDLLHASEYSILEEHHLRNFKNIIDLDPSLADEMAIIYANKLYYRKTGHKKANADKLIRLMKSVNQIMPKKVLAYLSSKNQITDIKYILMSFPDLKKLAAFV